MYSNLKIEKIRIASVSIIAKVIYVFYNVGNALMRLDTDYKAA